MTFEEFDSLREGDIFEVSGDDDIGAWVIAGMPAKRVEILKERYQMWYLKGIPNHHTATLLVDSLRSICSVLILVSKKVDIDAQRYPDICPRCGAPAYVGAVPSAVDCSAKCVFEKEKK